mmetsp:Transcript_11131/g.50397  ORF Transcript_11131/g.50397 Transcript_11131/m.50397 type:complete len:263 (-) Transcript_11131:815-1603(-)
MRSVVTVVTVVVARVRVRHRAQPSLRGVSAVHEDLDQHLAHHAEQNRVGERQRHHVATLDDRLVQRGVASKVHEHVGVGPVPEEREGDRPDADVDGRAQAKRPSRHQPLEPLRRPRMVHLRVQRVNHEMAHVRRRHHRDDGYGLAHARALGVGQESGRQRRDLPKHAGIPDRVATRRIKPRDDVSDKLEEQNRGKVRGAHDGHERRPCERLQAPHQAQRRAHQHQHVRHRRRSGAVPRRLVRHLRRVAVVGRRTVSVSSVAS